MVCFRYFDSGLKDDRIKTLLMSCGEVLEWSIRVAC